jgi:4-carboxymuconolactone decarboxylase
MSEHEKSSFQTGMQIRRDMFGPAGADDRLAATTDFTRPLEEVVTRYCFGETWARPGLDLKTRSIVTVSALAALGRPNQLKTHVRGALKNGVTRDEIREIILHTTVYAGIPAGVEAFNAAAEVVDSSNVT